MDGVSGPERLRVLLLGMRCRFTLPVAAALIADPGVDVAGAVVPDDGPVVKDCRGASARERPDNSSGRDAPLDGVLRRNEIPLVGAHSLRRRDLEPLLAQHGIARPDAVVTACFPWRVPRWLREVPRFGALNVHPSLLPALRGPEPEFWALRLGLRETGVTVHLMDGGLDTGPILLQRTVPIRLEETLPELESSLATVGGELAREALRGLATGEMTPVEQQGVASHAPAPSSYDLAIPTNLPAGWAATFARAVLPVYAPLPVLVMVTGQRLLVDSVIASDEGATQPAPIEGDGEIVAVRFSPGVVQFRRVPE